MLAGLCDKKSRFSAGEIVGMVLAVLAAGALLYLFQLGSEGRANLYRRVGDTIRGRHTPVEEEPVVPELNQETDAATVCKMEKGAVAPIYCMRIQIELTNPFPLPACVIGIRAQCLPYSRAHQPLSSICGRGGF